MAFAKLLRSAVPWVGSNVCVCIDKIRSLQGILCSPSLKHKEVKGQVRNWATALELFFGKRWILLQHVLLNNVARSGKTARSLKKCFLHSQQPCCCSGAVEKWEVTTGADSLSEGFYCSLQLDTNWVETALYMENHQRERANGGDIKGVRV